MTEEEQISKDTLAEISAKIFFENYNREMAEESEDNVTFNWQVDKNIESPSLSLNSDNNLQSIISAIKGKLDIISQNFCSDIDSPQLSYLKSLISTDLSAFSSSIDDSILQLNQAINNQQSINMTNGNVTLSEPILISIPLNQL